jgi:hypothetical protein
MGDDVNTALQGNLEKALRVADTFKRNYEVIKNAYHNLKVKHGELEKECEEAKDIQHEAVAAKEALERDCGQLYKHWHDHLKRQADEFSAIQAQMVPSKELEMLRIQMAEELEFPHKQRVAALTQVIQLFICKRHACKSRSMYFIPRFIRALFRKSINSGTFIFKPSVPLNCYAQNINIKKKTKLLC